jgi:glycosyltransferase involved in cell wall biosynthesis
VYEEHPFGYRSDVVLFNRSDNLLRKEFIRFISTFRVVLGFEVIHFHFGTTMAMPSMPMPRGNVSLSIFLQRWIHFVYTELLQVLEVTLLRLLRRIVVITYQGDDARQGDKSLYLFEESIAHHVDTRYYNGVSDRIKRHRIKRLDKIATHITFVNPDLQYFLPKRAKFVPSCHIDLPVVPKDLNLTIRRTLHILHAPSHQSAKGTQVLRTVISNLKVRGYQIDLTIIDHISHEEIGRHLDNCDLLIDQLYAGWYGGIGVEAMSRGTAVMTYLRDTDFDILQKEMLQSLPVISVTTDTLESQILKFIALSKEERIALRKKCIEYAHEWHSPTEIARTYSEMYQNKGQVG